MRDLTHQDQGRVCLYRAEMLKGRISLSLRDAKGHRMTKYQHVMTDSSSYIKETDNQYKTDSRY